MSSRHLSNPTLTTGRNVFDSEVEHNEKTGPEEAVKCLNVLVQSSELTLSIFCLVHIADRTVGLSRSPSIVESWKLVLGRYTEKKKR